MKDRLKKYLDGGDLRSIAKSNDIVKNIKNQKDFDELFSYLQNENRLIVMRTADAIEKISINSPEYLSPHHSELLSLAENAKDKELKWHLAQILPRLVLSSDEQYKIFTLFKFWLQNTKESRIVRVNALESLAILAKRNPLYETEFSQALQRVKCEDIPSLNARIRKLGL